MAHYKKSIKHKKRQNKEQKVVLDQDGHFSVSTWLDHVTQYFVKCQSRCSCEGTVKIWLIFKSVGLEKSRLFSMMLMGLIQSVGGLKWKDWGPWGRRNFAPRLPSHLILHHQFFSGSSPFWTALQILDLPIPQLQS